MKEYKNKNVPSIGSIAYEQSIYNNNKIILPNIFNNFSCVFRKDRGDYKHGTFRVLFPTNEDSCNVLFDGEPIIPLYEYNYYNNVEDNLSLKSICDVVNTKALKYISIRPEDILV